jgi:hypothetical protein
MTCVADAVKYTSTSEPSGSIRSAVVFTRRPAGTSDSRLASSKLSGRIPSTIVLPT